MTTSIFWRWNGWVSPWSTLLLYIPVPFLNSAAAWLHTIINHVAMRHLAPTSVALIWHPGMQDWSSATCHTIIPSNNVPVVVTIDLQQEALFSWHSGFYNRQNFPVLSFCKAGTFIMIEWFKYCWSNYWELPFLLYLFSNCLKTGAVQFYVFFYWGRIIRVL